ncbi:hypothetical protein AB0I77_31390 [Streptomyces sp. NPDC050619]|uniref:hypothetical protein n=1 Tax=Streptomyces sp. NPDC050619 TaxID=3157214 RepID=UPI003437C76E
MTVNVPYRKPPRKGRQGPSPLEGEHVRPLSRSQVEDRWQELGDLYAQTSGGGPRGGDQDRAGFLRRLAVDVRRPGFALLIAETVGVGDMPVLTGCAYGFPVCVDDPPGRGPSWRGLDGYLPEHLLQLASSGGLFAISGILVPPRVRAKDQDRDWNLARRLQKRLLTDHAAALGVILVDRGDTRTLEALRSWGWRSVATDRRNASQPAPCHVLIVGP